MRSIAHSIVLLALLSLFTTQIVLPVDASAAQSSSSKTTARIEETNGLKTAVFDAPAGRVRVNMPDDMAAGDTLSGTIYATPSGRDEKERSRNSSELNDYVVEVEDQASPASERIIKLNLAEKLPKDEVRVVLKDRKGVTVSRISFTAVTTAKEDPKDEYEIPRGAQTGNWINIRGTFDGDISNTGVDIGNLPAEPLAESPRKTVFQSPRNVVGLTEINFREGNTQIVQDFRNIDVKLSAEKLDLQRGETTNVTIGVYGLEGIEDEIPLHLTCSGSADMQGGNVQNLQISPVQVVEGGSYTQNRQLIGNKIGNFDISATVLWDAGVRVLNNNIVHVERAPADVSPDNGPKTWWIKVKTLDGKIKDVYILRESRPNLQFCDWILLTESRTDESGDTYVTTYQPAKDPNRPCALANQTVHVEGSPLKLPDGRWQIKITMPGGKTGFIYVRAPKKPDLKFCNWIKVTGCQETSSNTYEVGAYDHTEDPNKRPPATAKTPKPIPEPESKPTPVIRAPEIKPCKDGLARQMRKASKTFNVMDKESTVSMTLSTDKGGGNDAANFAGWLRGISTLGGLVEVPEGARAGAAVADAALKYLETGADILSALGKSGLGNKSVLEVKISIFITTNRVTATCESYEVCENGVWKKKKKYSETSKGASHRKDITIDPRSNDWSKITNSGTARFNPDKFEVYAKELLAKEIKKLQKNGKDLEALREKCN